MNEGQWLASRGAGAMLTFLAGKASERKLRLLAAAFCRRVWLLLTPADREAVRVAERYADGQVKPGPFLHRTRLGTSAPTLAGAVWLAGPRSVPAEHAAQVRRTATACVLLA